MAILYSIVESPLHPNYPSLYQRLGFQNILLTSTRKAVSQLKKAPPDVVVADFVYAYNNFYDTSHASNLDVFLMSLPRFAPEARVIILADEKEMTHAEKMRRICPVAAILPFGCSEAALEEVLR